MLFNSYPFLFIYFPLVLGGFFWLAMKSHRLASVWLAAASVFFYGYWNPIYVGLLLTSVVFNYAAGYHIGHLRGWHSIRANAVLTVAIFFNLALLGYFKYSNFFLGIVGGVANGGGAVLDVVLPLGISFFTFTQIAFLVDVRRDIAREYDFIHYLLFVTYFPHLIAGPVLHHKQMMPQFAHSTTYRIDPYNLAAGLTIFIIGLAKKLLIADPMALGASPLFSFAEAGGQPSFIEAWSGALCFAMQIYFDFSGYSDMAIGLSLCFGITLPLNFASPYKASSIIEFWRRWHITLSQFLRDYLYIPLGGNRKGTTRRYCNVFITMFLGGFWHGAGWTFLVWGALHGVFIVANQLWQDTISWRMPRILGWIITFTAVTIAWIPFRASTLDGAGNIFAGMLGMNGLSLPGFMAVLASLVPSVVQILPIRFDGLGSVNLWITGGALPVAFIIALLLPNTQTLMNYSYKHTSQVTKKWRASPMMAIMMGILFACCLLKLNDISEFIYFQF